MSPNGPGMKRYQSLGVKQIIAASGAVTAHGGSKLRPEVMAAMNDTAGLLVDMEALNRQEPLRRAEPRPAGRVRSNRASLVREGRDHHFGPPPSEPSADRRRD